MDEPLLLLRAAILAMSEPCGPCDGSGRVPDVQVSFRNVFASSDLPPNLAALQQTHTRPKREKIETTTGSRACYACSGRGRNATNEGRAVAELLARELRPFLDNALEPAPHTHEVD